MRTATAAIGQNTSEDGAGRYFAANLIKPPVVSVAFIAILAAVLRLLYLTSKSFNLDEG